MIHSQPSQSGLWSISRVSWSCSKLVARVSNCTTINLPKSNSNNQSTKKRWKLKKKNKHPIAKLNRKCIQACTSRYLEAVTLRFTRVLSTKLSLFHEWRTFWNTLDNFSTEHQSLSFSQSTKIRRFQTLYNIHIWKHIYIHTRNISNISILTFPTFSSPIKVKYIFVLFGEKSLFFFSP